MEGSSALLPANPADMPAALLAAPPVARGLAAVTLVLYLLGQVFPGLESVLAMKATNTYGAHAYVWNLFTAGFFNNSILLALAMAVMFLVMGRFLVPTWGGKELLRFLFFTDLLTGVIMFCAQIVYYMFSFNYQHLERPVSGGWPMIAALLVTIKQRVPDEMIMVNGASVAGLCARDLPGLMVVAAAGLSFSGAAPIFVQSVCGAYFGWVYLRFLQRLDGGVRGDGSEHMAFIMFFPAPLRPLVQVVSSSVHKAVCGKTVQALLDDLPHADPASVSGLPAGVFRGGFSGLLSDAGPAATVAPPLPGSDQADADRRRARALKSLEDRLRSIASDSGADAVDGSVTEAESSAV